MRSLAPIFLSLILTATLHAGPAVAVDSLAGIPFDSSPLQIQPVMDARGAKLSPRDSTREKLVFYGGTFNNRTAFAWHFYFAGLHLYQAVVFFNPADYTKMKTYADLKKDLSAKYGNPAAETKIDLDEHSLFNLVAAGKTSLDAKWIIPNPRLHSIECQLLKHHDAVMVKLTAQDDSTAARIADREKSDF